MMIKQYIIRLLLLVFVGGVGSLGYSQENTLYFLKGLPQVQELNAGAIPSGMSYMCMPGLGSLKADFTNSAFSYDELFLKGRGVQSDSLILNLDHLASLLQANNSVFEEVSAQIVGFGMYFGPSYFTFGVSHKLKGKISYPGSILDLRYGNWDLEADRPIQHSISDMSIDAFNYTEIGFGLARPFGEKLTLGLKFKLLFGAVNITTDKFALGVNTLSNGDMVLSTDARIQTTVPLVLEYDEEGYVDEVAYDESVDRGNIATNSNRGIAFDFGAQYKVSEKLTLAAAINDLGYINWKHNPTLLVSKGEFKYSGVDAGAGLTDDGEDDSYWEDLSDSIKNSFRISDERTTIRRGLHSTLNLSCDYDVKKWLNVGVLSRNMFYNGRVYPQFTVASGLHAGRTLSAILSYSLRQNGNNSFGVGLKLKAGAFQLYGATDTFNALFAPAKAKSFNFRAGLNFVFGKVEPPADEAVE